MGKISKEEIEYVAKLAKIELNDAEKEKFSEELSAVISYVEDLESTPTENILPIEQVSDLENVVRADEIAPSLENEKIIDNAPESKDGFIKTKQVFE